MEDLSVSSRPTVDDRRQIQRGTFIMPVYESISRRSKAGLVARATLVPIVVACIACGQTGETVQPDGELARAAAVATPLRATVHHTPDQILTWDTFRVDQWLSHRPVVFQHMCDGPWLSTPALSPGEITIPVAKGAVVVNGVTVREMTDDNIRFTPGRRYLLLVVDCGGGLAAFPFRFQGAYELGDDGALRLPESAVPETNLARDMMDVGTLEALTALLAR